MHYKNFFSAAALVTVLSLSNSAFSDSSPIGMTEDEDTSYYIRAQYNGDILPFKTKIEGIEIKKNNVADTTLDPYKASFIGGSGAFGYKMDDFRVELEGLYSQLNTTAGGTGTDKIESTPGTAKDLTIISGLVNVYYDVAIDDVPVAPYFGIGVGAAYINNPLATPIANTKTNGFGIAGQVKAGVSYAATPEIKVYAGARYFGSYGAKFDKTTKDDGVLKVLYSVVGAEAGVMFNF